MLVKEICKMCYDMHRKRSWDKFRRIDPKTKTPYVQKDRTWDRGVMFCVALGDWDRNPRPDGSTQIKVAGPPPACCYYFLEQTMKGAELEKLRNPDAPVQ